MMVTFEVEVHPHGDERVTPLIHEAIAEFTTMNNDGSWPKGTPFQCTNGAVVVVDWVDV